MRRLLRRAAAGETISDEELRGDDRRVDAARRQLVAEMTPEQRAHALLHDEATGLRNWRAWQEDERGPVKAVLDLDNFGGINAMLGHAGGDAAVAAVGKEARRAGINLYRIARSGAGDEFALHGPTEDAVRASIETLRARLAGATFDVERPDGTVEQWTGLDFSAGTGVDDGLSDADQRLVEDKERRAKAGLRAVPTAAVPRPVSPLLRRISARQSNLEGDSVGRDGDRPEDVEPEPPFQRRRGLETEYLPGMAPEGEARQGNLFGREDAQFEPITKATVPDSVRTGPIEQQRGLFEAEETDAARDAVDARRRAQDRATGQGSLFQKRRGPEPWPEPRLPVRYVRGASGSANLGEIGLDVSDAIGRQAGPIRLTRTDEAHIAERHGSELEARGYEGHEGRRDFVEDVARGYDEVRRGRAGRLLLVRRDEGTRLAVVGLRPEADRDFWAVETALFTEERYLQNKELLWERAPVVQSSAVAVQPGSPSAVSGHEAAPVGDKIASSGEEVNTDDEGTLFQRSRREAEAAGEGQERYQAVAAAPEKLSRKVLDLMNRRLKAMGYDSRGADDVRDMLVRNPRLMSIEEWQQAYDSAVGSVEETAVRAEGRKDSTPHVNWSVVRGMGTTRDWREAGYLRPDGTMLDFSGKQQGGSPGMRAEDHRIVGGTAGMQELQAIGYIRWLPEGNGLDLSAPPTSQQMGVLRQLIERAGGEVVVDLQRGLGEWDERYESYRGETTSLEYPAGTKAARILGDIRRYFDGEEFESGTRFQKSRRPPGGDDEKPVTRVVRVDVPAEPGRRRQGNPRDTGVAPRPKRIRQAVDNANLPRWAPEEQRAERDAANAMQEELGAREGAGAVGSEPSEPARGRTPVPEDQFAAEDFRRRNGVDDDGQPTPWPQRLIDRAKRAGKRVATTFLRTIPQGGVAPSDKIREQVGDKGEPFIQGVERAWWEGGRRGAVLADPLVQAWHRLSWRDRSWVERKFAWAYEDGEAMPNPAIERFARAWEAANRQVAREADELNVETLGPDGDWRPFEARDPRRYFPHRLTQEVRDALHQQHGPVFARLVEEANAQGIPIDVLRQLVDNSLVTKRHGSLEHPRLSRLPREITVNGEVVKVLETDPQIMFNHLRTAGRRLALIDEFGQHGSPAYIDATAQYLIRNGLDAKWAREVIPQIWERLQGEEPSHNPFQGAARTGLNILEAGTAATNLFAAVVPNLLGGPLPEMVRFGVANTLRNFVRSYTTEIHGEGHDATVARQLGNMSQDLARGMQMTERLEGLPGRMSKTILAATGFQAVNERINMAVALGMARTNLGLMVDLVKRNLDARRDAAQGIIHDQGLREQWVSGVLTDEQVSAQTGVRVERLQDMTRQTDDGVVRKLWGRDAGWARRYLTAELGFSEQDVRRMADTGPNERDVSRAIQKQTELVNAINESPIARPRYVANPVFRMVFAYSTYVRKFARTVEHAVREAGHGNVRPLVTLLVAGVASGEAIIAARNFLKDRKREEKGWLQRIYQDLMECGTFGMYGTVEYALKHYGEYGRDVFADALAPPQLGTLSNVTTGVVSSIMESRKGGLTLRPMWDALRRQAPLADIAEKTVQRFNVDSIPERLATMVYLEDDATKGRHVLDAKNERQNTVDMLIKRWTDAGKSRWQLLREIRRIRRERQ
ncbi:MAG TPA: hypothetical protein PLS53_12580 [Thermoanaerobaculaceae bacterium]|nr:hypothetical protein [Thermoanaerobaculaceae bacterium]